MARVIRSRYRWAMSHHGGDPSKPLPRDVLDGALDSRERAPRDHGRVTAIFTRQRNEGRTAHESLRFTQERGAEGDRWKPRRKGTKNQVTVMEHGVGQLIANGQSMALFGDNLVVDLALDAQNLPPGSRVRIGSARFEVTDEPHTGCHKYAGRFGQDALDAISREDRVPEHLRGIHFRVLEDGIVSVDDDVIVESRA